MSLKKENNHGKEMCDCSLVKWLFKISDFHACTLEGCATVLLGWHFLIFWKFLRL